MHSDQRKLHTLTMVDLFAGKCLAIEVGYGLRAEHVVAAMNQLKHVRGLPKWIACDNGSEFPGGQMDLWEYSNQV